MRSSLPSWLGWPGSGPAPGHDWLPGPVLRFVILGLTYGFLALSLTVNYAASVPFFLLAIIGICVGLRRGFLTGLSGPEKWALLLFAVYPAVAIGSYLAGVQTNVGFRFLGRDLRFLLFIPVYLAIRWSRPRAKHVGWALAVAAAGAFFTALVQNRPWPAPIPHGVAGTHITFGDLALLSGFLSAALLWPWKVESPRSKPIGWSVSVLAATFGICAAVLAGARGGWLAMPVLAAILILVPSSRGGANRRMRGVVFVGLLAVSGLSAWLVPSVHHRITKAYHSLVSYNVVANAKSINAPCVDRPDFLRALMAKSKFRGPGTVRIIRLPNSLREGLSAYGCSGGYAIAVSVPESSRKPVYLGLYRGNWPAGTPKQTATILARGSASFNLGWHGPWTRVSNAERWDRYGITKAFPLSDRTHRAHIKVRPGSSVLVIPMQEQKGAFAFPLAETSVGHRLEMWRAALALFRMHPLLGAGTGSFQVLGEAALGDSAAAPVVGGYEHAHSDYLTSLGTKGLLGLIAFLALLGIPVLLGFHFVSARQTFGVRLTALMLVSGVAVFGVTETMFVHSLVISWYVVVVAVIVRAEGDAELWASDSLVGDSRDPGLP